MGNPVEDYVDCYQNLANAIVLQAVKDYKAVLRRLMRNPCNQDAQREKKRFRYCRETSNSLATNLSTLHCCAWLHSMRRRLTRLRILPLAIATKSSERTNIPTL